MKKLAISVMTLFLMLSGSVFAGDAEKSFFQLLDAKQRQNLTLMKIRAKEYCSALGGKWKSGVCYVALDYEGVCTELGGKWVNNVCHFPGKCR